VRTFILQPTTFDDLLARLDAPTPAVALV